jgi:hypothetical protein
LHTSRSVSGNALDDYASPLPALRLEGGIDMQTWTSPFPYLTL